MSKQKSGKKKHKPQQAKPKGVKHIPQWAYLVGILAVTFLSLSPLLTADFVDIDDKKLILDHGDMFLNNPGRAFVRDFGGPHYKPVTYATWLLEYRLVGPNAFLFHLDNILLHLLNTFLVFLLASKVAVRFERLKEHAFPVACFTALLFGVHPLHVESVGWIVERKDVLFTCFYLLGLLGYVKYLNTQKILPLALSAVAYLFSLLSKAPGITMPAVLFLLDFVWQRKLSARLFIEKAGHFIVFAGALLMFGILGRQSGEGSVAAVFSEKKLAHAENISEHSSFYGKTVLAGLRAWLWYFHSFLPFNLALGYPREKIIGFFGPLIHVFPFLLLAAGGVVFWFRKKLPLLFFGMAFFFLTLAPAIVRLDLGIGIFMSDRYVYLSLFGLIFLVTGWLISTRTPALKPKVRYAILGGLALLMAIGSFRMSGVWKNTETLWTNVINKYPSVDYAWVNRAAFYRDQGAFDKGLSDANKGISLDENANAFMQRGLIYRQMGNPKASLPDYNRALELEPDNTQALTNRGNAYLDLGEFRKAQRDYEKVLETEPDNIKTRVNLAIAHSSMKEFDEADAEFEKALKSNPGYAEQYVNRAIMYYESRQYAKAVPQYLKYLRFRPDDHQIYYDLSVVYSLDGQFQKAVEAVTKAISMSQVREYYLLRAQAYDKLGNSAAAAQDRQTAQNL